MQTPEEIIQEFIQSLKFNEKVHPKIAQILIELQKEGKLNSTNIKKKLEQMTSGPSDDQIK